ncbi:MAG: hypothetical protein ACRENS_04235 [Candidatus Eiseniibacteriota bacterium]
MRIEWSGRLLRAARVLILGLLISTPAAAGGLRCSFGEVVINNLKIGQSYSLQTLANLPLVLTNTDDKPATIRVDALVPTEGELRQGAEPIPSGQWASALPDSFVLGPSQSQSVELKLSIPDDEQLFGRKFEVVFWSHTLAQAGNLIAYGLKSRVIFTIDQARDTANTAPQTGDLAIALSPSQVELNDVVAGHQYALEAAGHQPMMVKNTSDHPVVLELQPLSPEKSAVGGQPGFEDLLSFSKLSLAPAKLTLAPGEQKPVTATLTFPKGQSIKGRKFMCVISASEADQPVRTQIYSRIYVHAR